jgi:hypothetical protein
MCTPRGMAHAYMTTGFHAQAAWMRYTVWSRSHAQQLVPAKHSLIGPGHTLADWSRPYLHWLQTAPLPATPSPHTPLPLTCWHNYLLMSLSLSFLYLSLWHTPLVPLLSHLSLLPCIPLPAFGLIFPCIPLTAFNSTNSSCAHHLSSSMAQTKQTSRQSTGGTAKQQLLALPTQTLQSHSSHSSWSSHSLRATHGVEMVESPPLDSGASTAGDAVPQVVAGKVDQVASNVGVMGGNDADHVSEQ